MKRTRKPKRERPPERVRRSAAPLRRFETGLASAFALLLFFAWGAGIRIQDGLMLASNTPLPVGDGPVLGFAILIIGLIALNAVLIAAETAVASLRPAHLKIAREKNGGLFPKVQTLFDDRLKMMAALSLAVQTVRLVIVLSAFLLAPSLLDALHDRFGLAENYANWVFSALLLLIPIALVYLVVELWMKSFASVHPTRVGAKLNPLILATSFLFSLPAGLVTSLRARFMARFGASAEDEAANLAEEEIKTLAETGHEAGEIEVGEREMLHSVFEFTDTVAREVMTPRVDLDAMSVKSDPTEVMRLIQESGHSRIPLYEETDDQIVGIIHAKDLFGAMLNGKAPNLRSLMRQPHFVPENKSLHELLTEMRQGKTQLAVVQDEFGGTAGIVTIEDIVEELVGDIIDEYDVEEPEIVEAAGGWLVDGKTHLDDFNEASSGSLESEEFDTVGGYVFGLFGRQPKLGEEISHEGYRFIVAESDGRRILRLKVEPIPEEQEESAEE